MKREDLIIRKSFAIPHNNGAIWGENLDALYEFEDVVESKFLEDMKSIKRPSSPSAIAINLNQTCLTSHLAELMIENLIEAGASVRKVAFVGLDKEAIKRMKQALKTKNTSFMFQFFSDFMKAKDWLVSPH